VPLPWLDRHCLNFDEFSDIGRADTGELVQLRRQCEAETSAAIGRFIVGSHVSTMRFKPKPRPVLLPWQPVAARKAAG